MSSQRAVFVGLAGGVVRREHPPLRRGMRVGFIYHRVKASLISLAVLPWVTYLALTVSVNPPLILLPSAVLLGAAMDIAVGEFQEIPMKHPGMSLTLAPRSSWRPTRADAPPASGGYVLPRSGVQPPCSVPSHGPSGWRW